MPVRRDVTGVRSLGRSLSGIKGASSFVIYEKLGTLYARNIEILWDRDFDSNMIENTVNFMSTLTDWVILRFEQLAPWTLKLYFRDQTEQLINFEPVLHGAWLRPLRDPQYFAQVKLNDTGNLEWPDGQDFNPEALHDWPQFETFYLEDACRAKEWENAEPQRQQSPVAKKHPACEPDPGADVHLIFSRPNRIAVNTIFEL